MSAWGLARAQHDVISHQQLRRLGFSEDAIRHRARTGRLFVLWRGVYAVGRPQVSRRGRWKAATLACGPGCAVDGHSGLALWGIRDREGPRVEIAVPEAARRMRRGIALRRVRGLADHVTEIQGIPVLSLPSLLVRLAGRVPRGALEAALNEVDKRDLIELERLRIGLEAHRGRPGVATLRTVIDRSTFRFSDSELERAFRPVARAVGLSVPETKVRVNGFEVDFFWPSLDLVIETDGGRFHRTPFQQTRDRLRDQAHTAAGTAHLRFTHAQIRWDRPYVERTVARVVRRLQATVGVGPVPQAR